MQHSGHGLRVREPVKGPRAAISHFTPLNGIGIVAN
jgi:hypothetical protein